MRRDVIWLALIVLVVALAAVLGRGDRPKPVETPVAATSPTPRGGEARPSLESHVQMDTQAPLIVLGQVDRRLPDLDSGGQKLRPFHLTVRKVYKGSSPGKQLVAVQVLEPGASPPDLAPGDVCIFLLYGEIGRDDEGHPMHGLSLRNGAWRVLGGKEPVPVKDAMGIVGFDVPGGSLESASAPSAR